MIYKDPRNSSPFKLRFTLSVCSFPSLLLFLFLLPSVVSFFHCFRLFLLPLLSPFPSSIASAFSFFHCFRLFLLPLLSPFPSSIDEMFWQISEMPFGLPFFQRLLPFSFACVPCFFCFLPLHFLPSGLPYACCLLLVLRPFAPAPLLFSFGTSIEVYCRRAGNLPENKPISSPSSSSFCCLYLFVPLPHDSLGPPGTILPLVKTQFYTWNRTAARVLPNMQLKSPREASPCFLLSASPSCDDQTRQWPLSIVFCNFSLHIDLRYHILERSVLYVCSVGLGVLYIPFSSWFAHIRARAQVMYWITCIKKFELILVLFRVVTGNEWNWELEMY